MRRYSGLRFLEAAHVKDMLSVLRWAENPRSRLAGSGWRSAGASIGPATANHLLMDAMAQAADPLAAMREFNRARRRNPVEPNSSPPTRRCAARRPWPADVDAALQWYGPPNWSASSTTRACICDLEQLARLAGGYPTRERFLTELTLDPPDATSDGVRSAAAQRTSL